MTLCLGFSDPVPAPAAGEYTRSPVLHYTEDSQEGDPPPGVEEEGREDRREGSEQEDSAPSSPTPTTPSEPKRRKKVDLETVLTAKVPDPQPFVILDPYPKGGESKFIGSDSQ